MREWHTAFKVLAHEIRSPVGVIVGYVRMLGSGRLDATATTEALQQIDRAADRLAQLGRQASDLASWLEPRIGFSGDMLPLEILIGDAMKTVASADRVDVVRAPDTEALRVHVSDRRALSAAVATFITATLREVDSPDDHVSVATRRDPRTGGCDVLIGRSAQLDDLDALPDVNDATSLDLDRGGLGLQMLLSAAILDAHGVQFWSLGGRRGMVGIRFPHVK
jgi:K+-sensing histidine kinase KdpD